MVFSLRCQKKENKKRTPVTFKYELCRQAAQSKFHKDKISLKFLSRDSSPISQRTNFLLGPKSAQDIICSVATTHSIFLLWLMQRMHLKPTRKRAHCGSINLFIDSWKKRSKFSHTIQCICETSGFYQCFPCWRSLTISNQSQHCSEESFSTLLQREEAFMWSENTRLIFFSSYETLLFKQPEWIVSVHVLKSHHIHLGMDVLGCWKSGPLVHRATKSPDQQFQNVPFSYIASMHTS